MMKNWMMVVAGSLLFTHLSVRAEETATAVRNGFTLEAGLGGSFVSEIHSSEDSSNRLGRDALSVGLGGFVTPSLALLVRFSQTSFKPASAHGTTSDVSSLWFLGAHVQYWLTDRFFVSGGPGYVHFDHVFAAVYGAELHEQYQNLGFSIRTGFAFGLWENHTLRISLEAIPAFFERTTIMGEALSLEWQWF